MATRPKTPPTNRHPAPRVPETPPANMPIPPRVPTPQEDLIRTRAYHLWEAAGKPDGDGTDFWCQAERELRDQ